MKKALFKPDFEKLINVVPTPLCLLDKDGTIVFFNNRFHEMFGYSSTDIPRIDDWWLKAYPDVEYRIWVMNNWNKAVENSIKNNTDIKSDTYKVTCKNGETKNIIIGGVTFEDKTLADFLDVSEIEKSKLLLKTKELRYKELFESMPNGWARHKMVFDKKNKPIDYIFLEANKAFEDYTGMIRVDILNKKVSEVIPGIEKSGLVETYAKVAETGKEHIFETFFEPFNKWYKVTAYSHEKNYFATIFEDITHKKESEKKILEINKKLSQSNKELEQFAYVASHDLQEPLRMVSSYTQLLEKKYKDKLDDKAKMYINFAVDGAVRMQNLINDLLEFSRISTRGREFEKVDTVSSINIVLHNLQHIINDKNANIIIDDLPKVLGDKIQIQQLFQNLVSNAIKFCNEKPSIHITAKKVKNFWKFCVSDNGIGIDNKFNDKIFVIFQRLNSTRDYKGTGIGLAVCKRIILRHGGKIWFKSNENKGTNFYFTIPAIMNKK